MRVVNGVNCVIKVQHMNQTWWRECHYCELELNCDNVRDVTDIQESWTQYGHSSTVIFPVFVVDSGEV